LISDMKGGHMMWYHHLKTVAYSAAATLALVGGAVADSYATDTWDFSDAEKFTVPASVSAVPWWTTVLYEDTLLWDGCELFLEEHVEVLSGMTIPDCVGIIAKISGLSNPDRVPAGAMVMVPSPRNTSADIADQRTKRTSLRELANNPMGMAEALLAFNRDVDKYNARLEKAEGQLAEHDERLSRQADQLSELENQVMTLADSTGANLSEAEVRSIATKVLENVALESGMTEFEVQAQIQAALDEQRDKFEKWAADVAALRQELESLRSSQMSPEAYAQTALEIARDVGVSETQVKSVVQTALADLGLVSPKDMSAAIEAAVKEVQSRVSTLETQVHTLQEKLRNLRSDSSMSPESYAQAAIAIARDLGMSEADVAAAVQTALAELDIVSSDDVSAAIEAALDERDLVSQADLDGRDFVTEAELEARGLVGQQELDTALQDAGTGTPSWVPVVSVAALGLGFLTLFLLWLKSRRDKRQHQDLSSGLEAAKSAAENADQKAESASTEAGEAKTLAAKAMTTAKVAVDLHLKPDQRLKGDLPSEKELKELSAGDWVDVTIRKDDGTDVVVRFTRVTNLLDDGKGNRFDGFRVDGIDRLRQGVKMHPSRMLGIIARANKNNTLGGIDKTTSSS
jgi:predicted  nucleic acid-binding Zn-ribbon protein